MRFKVGTQCSKTWDELTGDGRQRHCSDCQKSVHSFNDYSPEELDRLWNESGGQLCGALRREAEPQDRSRRAVLAGALLTAISPLIAQTGQVSFKVTDPGGTVIPNTSVKLLDGNAQVKQTSVTDQYGVVNFSGLPIGNTRFHFEVPGFAPKSITVTAGIQPLSMTVTLEFPRIDIGVMVAEPLSLAQTGTVRFKVADPTGAPLPETYIDFDSKGPETRRISTDSDGIAEWPDLPIGRTAFVARKAGFFPGRTSVIVSPALSNSEPRVINSRNPT